MAERHIVIKGVVAGLGWLPIPLLALVVFLVAGSQVSLVVDSGTLLWRVVGVFVLYLVVAATLGKLLSQTFRLPAVTGCMLTFSPGTLNSFVMLPLALSLPEVWSAVVVVIVLQ